MSYIYISKNLMYIISHRGGALEYKENTIYAFKKSLENDKVSGIELDIHFTRDNEIIINHDTNLIRIFGINENISDINYEQIKTIVLSFENILNIIKGKKPLFIDIKGSLTNEQIEILSNIMIKYLNKYSGLEEYYDNNIPMFLLMSFNYNVIKNLNKYFYKSHLGFITANNFDKVNFFYIIDNKLFDYIILDGTNTNTETLNEIRKSNINILLYGVNYPISLNKFNENDLKNIYGFITDSPTQFYNILCNNNI
jgi:glycerophosphoryl diester phosphodiesterase